MLHVSVCITFRLSFDLFKTAGKSVPEIADVAVAVYVTDLAENLAESSSEGVGLSGCAR